VHFSLQFALWVFVPTAIYKEIAALIPPYFTGLSVFAGLWVFGLSGVVYGPVIMNIVPVIYRALKHRVLLNDIT
jgi:predicted PurR-regulated permease PerM